MIAGTSVNNSLLVWDVGHQPPSLDLVQVIKGHSREINGLAFASDDGSTFVSVSEDGSSKTWDLTKHQPSFRLGKIPMQLPDWSHPARLTYTGDGNELWITTARDVKRFGFNIETHDLIAPTDPKGFRTIAVSRDGAWQAGSAEDGHLAIWDAREGVLRAKHPTLMAEAGSIAVFSNGPTVYWCGGPTSVGHIWNVSEGTTRTIGGGLNGLPDLSPSCDRMAVYHWDTTMVWDITVDPPVLVWENHGWGPEFRTLFSPGGDLVAVPSFSSQLRLIATDTGEVVRTLKGHTDMVTSVQFSNDGSWLVSGGVDRAVRIWDVETGQLLSTFFNPDGPVWAVALSPNEDSIASLTDAGLVRLWTIATPEEVDQYEKH